MGHFAGHWHKLGTQLLVGKLGRKRDVQVPGQLGVGGTQTQDGENTQTWERQGAHQLLTRGGKSGPQKVK